MRTQFRRRPLVLVLAASVWGAACPAHAESLFDVVMDAIAQHPQARLAVAQRAGAQAGVDEARAAFKPTIGLDMSAGPRRQDTALGHGAVLDERSAALTLDYTLYDGGSRSAELERQRARAESMAGRERETRERIAMDAIEAYANYLSAREMHELAQQNLESHRSVVNKMQELVKIDAGRRFELSQALARYSLAEVVLTARRVRLRESALQYARVVGHEPNQLDPLAMPELPATLEQAVDIALRMNPAIAIAEAEIRTSARGLQVSQAQLKPKIQLELTGRRSRDAAGNLGRSGDTALQVSAHWNLFDGGAQRARIRAATEDVNAAMATADDTRRTVRENLSVAWNTMRGHADSNRELQVQVRFAKETLEAYHDQFRIGRRSVLDVLNAENELFTARSNLVSGHYSEKVAAFQLLATQGRLLDAIERNVPVKSR